MIKLYLDEDVHKKIATALRLKGYDVLSAHEVSHQGFADYQQLEYAVSAQRASSHLRWVISISFIRNI
jgi:uncharacterized protein with PIN domain